MKRLFLFTAIFFLLGNSSFEFVDIVGNKIVVPPYPKRIVSLAPSITECLFAIGAGEKVVGVTRFSDFPEEAKKIPKVGSYLYPNLERILGLKPDLCIVTKDGNPRDFVYRLKNLGIDIYAVDPRDIHSILVTLDELGKIVGCEKNAQKVIFHLKQRVANVRKRAKKLPKKPKVFFQIGVNPMVTIGKNTLINNMIELSGGINVFHDSVQYPRVSVEQVLGVNPDIIIVTTMIHSMYSPFKLKEFWLKYKDINAVKNNNVFVLESDYFNRPSPRAVEGLEILSEIFYKTIVN